MSKTCPQCLRNGLTVNRNKIWGCLKCGYWSNIWFKGQKLPLGTQKYWIKKLANNTTQLTNNKGDEDGNGHRENK